jgi:hypothetical protein
MIHPKVLRGERGSTAAISKGGYSKQVVDQVFILKDIGGNSDGPYRQHASAYRVEKRTVCGFENSIRFFRLLR